MEVFERDAAVGRKDAQIAHRGYAFAEYQRRHEDGERVPEPAFQEGGDEGRSALDHDRPDPVGVERAEGSLQVGQSPLVAADLEGTKSFGSALLQGGARRRGEDRSSFPKLRREEAGSQVERLPPRKDESAGHRETGAFSRPQGQLRVVDA